MLPTEMKMFWKHDSHSEQDILVTSAIHSVLRYSGNMALAVSKIF
jgi:hypothetical protein